MVVGVPPVGRACPECILTIINPHPDPSPSPFITHPRILPPPNAPSSPILALPVATNVAADLVASRRSATLVAHWSSCAVASPCNDAAGGPEGIDVCAKPVANARSETPIPSAPTLSSHVVVGVSAKRGAKERSTASTPLRHSWSFASACAARDVSSYTYILDVTLTAIQSPGMGPHTPIAKGKCHAGGAGVACGGVEVAGIRVSSCKVPRCATATWPSPPPGRRERSAAHRQEESGETPRRKSPCHPRDAPVPWARAMVSSR